MKINSLLLFSATLALTASSAVADTLPFFGNTTGLPVFNRTTEPGDALSDIGTAVSYYTLPFTVAVSGSYNLAIQANDPGAYDTFLHLYRNSFNAANPLNNFLAANDDASGGSASGSALLGISLTAGNSYFLIADGFANSDNGAFTGSISGPGAISVVPEPSSFALIGFSLAGFCWARRRQIFHTH